MSDNKAGASEFDKLLGEINDLSKALPANGDTAEADNKIEAAAEDGTEGAGADENADVDADAGNDGVAKSFKLKLEDGTEVDAMDGTEILKSLTARVEKQEVSFVGAMRTMLNICKSLQTEVTKLRNAGKGRKAVVAITEKPAAGAAGEDVNKAESTISVQDFMAKATAQYSASKISAHDLNLAETCINQGKAVPERIVRAVMGL